MPIFIKAGYWEKMRIGLKGYFNLDDYVKTLIDLFGGSKEEDIQFIFGDIINGKVYQLITKARYDFTINSIALQTDVGTATVAIKINGTNVTGLSAVGATNSIVDTNATAANSVAIGDIVTLTISSIVTATSLSGNLKITRV